MSATTSQQEQGKQKEAAGQRHKDRAVYYVPSNSFQAAKSVVPIHSFEAERVEALRQDAPSAIIPLDLSKQMGLEYPATVPSILLRYLRLAKDQPLTLKVQATSVIYYVISGQGRSRASQGGDEIRWSEGDIFMFPGTWETEHQSSGSNALLYAVTDEPLLRYGGLMLNPESAFAHEVVHYTAEEIERHLELQYARERSVDDAGRAVIFATESTSRLNTTTPFLAVNINTLEPGGDQRPHRHNAVALTLSVDGEGVYSEVDGVHVDWKPAGVLVTPPGALHSHHSRGSKAMRSIVVQDSGVFYHSRIVGFTFDR